MITTIWGTKQQQNQTWTPEGIRVPVTVIRAFPLSVNRVKTTQTDGYQAIQVGFEGKKREIRGAGEEVKVGEVIEVTEVLKPGDLVKVTGKSRGKGFTGVVKRWGFAGGPKTHGQSDRLRAPGAIGQGTDPGRIHKGKKMAGRAGGQTVTVKNLKVIKVEENGEVWVSGLVPGNKRGLVKLTKTSRKYA